MSYQLPPFRREAHRRSVRVLAFVCICVVWYGILSPPPLRADSLQPNPVTPGWAKAAQVNHPNDEDVPAEFVGLRGVARIYTMVTPKVASSVGAELNYKYNGSEYLAVAGAIMPPQPDPSISTVLDAGFFCYNEAVDGDPLRFDVGTTKGFAWSPGLEFSMRFAFDQPSSCLVNPSCVAWAAANNRTLPNQFSYLCDHASGPSLRPKFDKNGNISNGFTSSGGPIPLAFSSYEGLATKAVYYSEQLRADTDAYVALTWYYYITPPHDLDEQWLSPCATCWPHTERMREDEAQVKDALDIRIDKRQGFVGNHHGWYVCQGHVPNTSCEVGSIVESPDVAVVSYVDGGDLPGPSGNVLLQLMLNADTRTCVSMATSWTLGHPFLLFNEDDRQYALNVILRPGDVVPGQTIDYLKYERDRHLYRAYQRFQVRRIEYPEGPLFELTHAVHQQGTTHYPCVWPQLSVVGEIVNTTMVRFAPSEAHPADGDVGKTQNKIWQHNSGRVWFEGRGADYMWGHCTATMGGFCFDWLNAILSGEYTQYVWSVIPFDEQTLQWDPVTELVAPDVFNSYSVYEGGALKHTQQQDSAWEFTKETANFEWGGELP